jgi:hypothetical protein
MKYRVEFESKKTENYFEEYGHSIEDLKWDDSHYHNLPERLEGGEYGYFKYSLHEDKKTGEKYIYVWMVRRNRMI